MPLNHTKGLIRKIFRSSKGKTDGEDHSSHSLADSQADDSEHLIDSTSTPVETQGACEYRVRLLAQLDVA